MQLISHRILQVKSIRHYLKICKSMYSVSPKRLLKSYQNFQVYLPVMFFLKIKYENSSLMFIKLFCP